MPGWKKKIIFALLLILETSLLHASGKTLSKVNVSKMGYRVDYEKTIVRWRGNYVVIGSVKYIPDLGKNQCIVSFDPEQPLLVFDVIARKQAPADAMGRLEQEWEPPHSRWPRNPCAPDKHEKSEDLPEPLTSDLDYHSVGLKSLVVLDKNHRERFRISPGLFSCWSGCVTSSRSGNRFALLDKGRTLGKWISDNTVDLISDFVDTNKKRIRVYDAKDGKKLYQVSWVEPECQDCFFGKSERVALSDDGGMLAILDDEGVLHVVLISER